MANVGFDADGFITGDTFVAVAVDTDADQSPFVYVNTTNKAVKFVMHLSDADILVRDDKYEEGQAFEDGYVFVLPPYQTHPCLLYTSPSPRDRTRSRMPSSA